MNRYQNDMILHKFGTQRGTRFQPGFRRSRPTHLASRLSSFDGCIPGLFHLLGHVRIKEQRRSYPTPLIDQNSQSAFDFVGGAMPVFRIRPEPNDQSSILLRLAHITHHYRWPIVQQSRSLLTGLALDEKFFRRKQLKSF